MYNGIGLKTPRGSGTNGYVTRNLSFAKQKHKFKEYDYSKETPASVTRKPNDDILLHKSKREIEVECLQLRERLECQK
jgi:serine/arginine repetitive matrix protein 2